MSDESKDSEEIKGMAGEPGESEDNDVIDILGGDDIEIDVDDLDEDDEDLIIEPETEQEEVIELLMKIQRQLLFLEKKIDALAGSREKRGGDERPRSFDRERRPEGRSFQKKSYDRPFQRFDRDDRPKRFGDDRPKRFDRDDRPRHFERDERPRHAWDEDGAEREERRPAFRDNDSSREHYFERRKPSGPRKPGGSKPRFSKPGGKKPFYSRFKD